MGRGGSQAPLESPALGTSLAELVSPCGDALRPADPPPPVGRSPVAATFSGGGFRATLAALGVVRALADLGLLHDLRYVSSVSGGSIAAARLALAWPEVRTGGFSAQSVDRHVIGPIVGKVSGRSLKRKLLRNLWRAAGRRTRTDLLADALDDWWFDRALLEELDPGCRWILNAANLTTGARFAFERDVLGDYVLGLLPTTGTGVRVALAVAASAAVPGVFAQVRLGGLPFPCSGRGEPRLLDGGAYDNTGLEALDGPRYRQVFSVSLNAGGVFVTGRPGRLPIVGDLQRANSLLYRQSTALRTRWMVDRFRALEAAPDDPPPWGRSGVLVGLGSSVVGGGRLAEWTARFPEHRDWEGRDLVHVPTVFDRFDAGLCRRLVYRGWWLGGAAVARYHPDRIIVPLESIEPPES